MLLFNRTYVWVNYAECVHNCHSSDALIAALGFFIAAYLTEVKKKPTNSLPHLCYAECRKENQVTP